MKPFSETRFKKDSLLVKLYSRPSFSPGRGLRVVWDILKPNFSGYSAKRRFRRVLLPVPLGPETTTGRNFWTGFVVSFAFAVLLFLLSGW